MPETTSPRLRRAPARAEFDPATPPWSTANQGLARIADRYLAPDALRALWAGITRWQRDDPVGHEMRYPGREQLVPAAVLVPLVMRPDGLRVMLTQRTAHLHDHAGQISFPGGRAESSDAGPAATALREAQEETGLRGEFIEILGDMPPYVTSTGFSVTPVVGLVKPGFELAPDTFEVAEVFETPLAFLMDPGNHRLYQAPLADGRVRQYYAMPWQRYFIWGATAGMLRNLYRTLYAETA